MDEELDPDLLARLQRLTQQAAERRGTDEAAPGAQLSQPLAHLRNQRDALAADGTSAPDFPDAAGAAQEIERLIKVIEEAQDYVRVLEAALRIFIRLGVPQVIVEAQAAQGSPASAMPPISGSGITAL